MIDALFQGVLLMPMEIRDLDDGRGVLITGYGHVTSREYLDSLLSHLNQDAEKFKRYRYSLSDYTEVTNTDVSSADIKRITRQCIVAAQHNPDAVLAFVATRDLIYGLARMTEILIEETNWDIKTFRTRDEAVSWIKERARDKFGIDDLPMRPA